MGHVMEPRIVRDLSDIEYHDDHESLSASGAKLLLDSPARFRHRQDYGQEPRPAFDLGHAVHTEILGVGQPTVVIPEDLLGANGSTSTKAAKEWMAEQREQGCIPVKAEVHEQVMAMAGTVRGHDLAKSLMSDGEPEVSVYVQDEDTGVIMRARPDWHRPGYIVDLKTTVDANPAEFGRTAAKFGYHIQAAWYLDVLTKAGMADDQTRFMFVLAEKDAPHLVSVVELDPEAIDLGRDQYRRALEIYAHCTETGTWPGYPTTEAPVVNLPAWYYRTSGDDL